MASVKRVSPAGGEADRKAAELVETVLKPRLVSVSRQSDYNEVIDVVHRWRGDTLYFISIYRVGTRGDIPGDTFEAPFARIQPVGDGGFAISYMRHTGKWAGVYTWLTFDECLEAVRDEPIFTG